MAISLENFIILVFKHITPGYGMLTYDFSTLPFSIKTLESYSLILFQFR